MSVVTLTINDKLVSAPANATLLNAIQEQGIDDSHPLPSQGAERAWRVPPVHRRDGRKPQVVCLVRDSRCRGDGGSHPIPKGCSNIGR